MIAQSGLCPAVEEKDSSLSGLVEVILNFRTVHSWPRENDHPCSLTSLIDLRKELQHRYAVHLVVPAVGLTQILSERHLGASSGGERLALSRAMDLLVCH